MKTEGGRGGGTNQNTFSGSVQEYDNQGPPQGAGANQTVAVRLPRIGRLGCDGTSTYQVVEAPLIITSVTFYFLSETC